MLTCRQWDVLSVVWCYKVLLVMLHCQSKQGNGRTKGPRVQSWKPFRCLSVAQCVCGRLYYGAEVWCGSEPTDLDDQASTAFFIAATRLHEIGNAVLLHRYF